MPDRLSLPVLLSQALVAYIIEFDNEFEVRMPHRTSTGGRSGSGSGPWLVSMVMWANFLRVVPDGGAPLHALQTRADLVNLAGLERWGYVMLQPDPDDARSNPPRRDWIVRLTGGGRMAQGLCATLEPMVERRWEIRFGSEQMEALRTALCALIAQLPAGLPPALPVVGYGLFTRLPPGAAVNVDEGDAGDGSVAALLSRVLLAFVLAFERHSPVSLPVAANVLRVLDGDGVPLRDLPRMGGVSKEGVQMAVNWLQKRGFVTLVSAYRSAGGVKIVRLTQEGERARDDAIQRVRDVEERWEQCCGREVITRLRDTLEALVVSRDGGPSPLFLGLEPPPAGWRARISRPETLPHHPMVLHRGGFPDGS